MSEPQHPSVSISLTLKSAAEGLEFYKRAFGAEELFRMDTPGGGVAHGEFMIGDTRIFISDEAPEWHALAMPEGATASCLFSILVENCDAAFQRAVEAGAEGLSEPQDQFWGSRSAVLRDPFGYRWSVIQPLEDLSPEEIMERARKLFGAG